MLRRSWGQLRCREEISRGVRTEYSQGEGWVMCCAGAGVILEGCQVWVRSGSKLIDIFMGCCGCCRMVDVRIYVMVLPSISRQYGLVKLKKPKSTVKSVLSMNNSKKCNSHDRLREMNFNT